MLSPKPSFRFYFFFLLIAEASTDSPAGLPGSSLFLIYTPHCRDSYPVVFTHTHTLPPLLLYWDYVPLPLVCLSASPDPTCPLGMLPGSKQLDKRSSRIQKCPLGAGGSIQLVIGTCLAQGSGVDHLKDGLAFLQLRP